MIVLNDNWWIEVGPRKHDYVLIERRKGKSKDGSEKITESKTFHPTFDSIATKLLNKECMMAIEAGNNLQELISTIESVKNEITRNISQ